MKTPEQLSRQAIDARYGLGTDWEHPNQYGEEGFTRAQAESDIDADDIRTLITRAITADREQIRIAIAAGDAIPGLRPHPVPHTTDLVEAWEAHKGDVDCFFEAWDNYLRGRDLPCPDNPAGLHDVTDGSCNHCGDKNRS